MKTIAICSNIQEFDGGPPVWTQKQICDKYPGSHWLRSFTFLARENGYVLYSGLQAKKLIENGLLNPEDITLIQEEDNVIGETLGSSGCKRAVVICLESPLYTPRFYDRMKVYRMTFPYQIFFGTLGNVRAYFPSFDENQEIEYPIWEERYRELCIVASNKHYSSFAHLYPDSFSFQGALQNQLHDKRYDAILKLKPRVYGKNWDPKLNIEIPPGDKIKVMQEFKYALCFENVVMPSYVTEKIIDCFLAGTIPIYLGAPDIEEFIPPTCFITLEHFKNKKNTLDMVSRLYHARQFLRSQDGRKFSYQSFARTVLECIEKSDQS